MKVTGEFEWHPLELTREILIKTKPSILLKWEKPPSVIAIEICGLLVAHLGASKGYSRKSLHPPLFPASENKGFNSFAVVYVPMNGSLWRLLLLPTY